MIQYQLSRKNQFWFSQKREKFAKNSKCEVEISLKYHVCQNQMLIRILIEEYHFDKDNLWNSQKISKNFEELRKYELVYEKEKD